MIEVVYDSYDRQAAAAMQTASTLARVSGVFCSLHLLVGLAESGGVTAETLIADEGCADLRSIVYGDCLGRPGPNVHLDDRSRQVTDSAVKWARDEGRSVSPEHLIVAVAEQGSRDILAVCEAAGIDLRHVRDSAVARLGWSTESVPRLVALEPTGAMDRVPLLISDLPDAAWTEAQQRLARLPFARVRREWEWDALRRNEQRAAWGLADKFGLNDHQRYSLLHHYCSAIESAATAAMPQALRPQALHPGFVMYSELVVHSKADSLGVERWRVRGDRLLGGWACWLENRKTGFQDRWFRLTCRY